VFASIAKYGYSDHETDITIEFASKNCQNIYNTYVFAGIVKYGYSDHETDITIAFA
jgi:sialic acid synthase SpsE